MIHQCDRMLLSNKNEYNTETCNIFYEISKYCIRVTSSRWQKSQKLLLPMETQIQQ